MTRHQFLKILDNPGAVESAEHVLVEDTVRSYPYFQSAQVLLACNFYPEDTQQYSIQLKKAAAYAGDRRVLRELIDRAKKTKSVPLVQEVFVPEPIIPVTDFEKFVPDDIPEQPVIVYNLPTYERMTQEELLDIVKKRLAEINAERKREQAVTVATDIKELAEESGKPEVIVTKASLIDKFIHDEPRISKPKATFFNPTDSSIRSNFDEEEIVSETLAQLYARQGNLQKAKHIYEKLSLINQEKCRYFAAQIEKLTS